MTPWCAGRCEIPDADSCCVEILSGTLDETGIEVGAAEAVPRSPRSATKGGIRLDLRSVVQLEDIRTC